MIDPTQLVVQRPNGCHAWQWVQVYLRVCRQCHFCLFTFFFVFFSFFLLFFYFFFDESPKQKYHRRHHSKTPRNKRSVYVTMTKHRRNNDALRVTNDSERQGTLIGRELKNRVKAVFVSCSWWPFIHLFGIWVLGGVSSYGSDFLIMRDYSPLLK